MQNFSEAVIIAMGKRHITIAQIAKMSGYSWAYINDLLKNKRRWNEETMNKVSIVVGLKIRYQLDELSAKASGE